MIRKDKKKHENDIKNDQNSPCQSFLKEKTARQIFHEKSNDIGPSQGFYEARPVKNKIRLIGSTFYPSFHVRPNRLLYRGLI